MSYHHPLKFCKDCAHMKYKLGTMICLRPGLEIKSRLNMVTGEIDLELNYCSAERIIGVASGGCGPEGKYFEQRKKKWYDNFLNWLYD